MDNAQFVREHLERIHSMYRAVITADWTVLPNDVPVVLEFPCVRYAATWHRDSGTPDAQPELFGPLQFEQVEIRGEGMLRSFTEPVTVSAVLRAEWVEWLLRVNCVDPE